MLSFVLAKARTKDNNAIRFVSPNRTNLFFAYYKIVLREKFTQKLFDYAK